MEWHYRLYKDESKALNFEYDPGDPENLIICKQGREGRRFAMFSTPAAFLTCSNRTESEDRCYYEVIMGDRPRKPYFDIDIDLSQHSEMTRVQSDALILKFTDNIKTFLEEHDLKILVFTSHRPDKLSYHIIIDKVFLATNEDSKVFADKVLIPEMRQFIDSRVYNKVQQLRIVGSRKFGKDNVKKVDFKLSDGFYIPVSLTPEQREMYILQSSLITITQNRTPLVMKRPVVLKSKRIKHYDIDDAMDALTKVYSNFEQHQIREYNGTILIELRSKCPYYCNIHKREHHHENAFILIKGMMKNIWFDCRRIESHEKNLGREFIASLFRPKQGSDPSALKGFSLIRHD